MSAEFTVAIKCDVKTRRVCQGSTPVVATTATEARKSAADKGWEVMRGKHGRDVCPPCRIAEIRSKSQLIETSIGGESQKVAV